MCVCGFAQLFCFHDFFSCFLGHHFLLSICLSICLTVSVCMWKLLLFLLFFYCFFFALLALFAVVGLSACLAFLLALQLVSNCCCLVRVVDIGCRWDSVFLLASLLACLLAYLLAYCGYGEPGALLCGLALFGTFARLRLLLTNDCAVENVAQQHFSSCRSDLVYDIHLSF